MNIISKIERDNYFKGLENSLKDKDFKNVQLVLCPPVVHLETFRKKIQNKFISLGCQNIHTEERGKFTGEVSAPMVKNFGGEFVVVGHSERRMYFGENNGLIGQKIKVALKNDLTPILCVGETLAQRESGEMKNVISSQLLEGLHNINELKMAQIIIAYEPIWSIGSGKVPTSDEIMEVRILMQRILMDKMGVGLERMPQIIYGGSVEYRNVQEVCIDAGMSGVLIGGESLHPIDFIKIAEILENN